jgi:hypothetical protein
MLPGSRVKVNLVRREVVGRFCGQMLESHRRMFENEQHQESEKLQQL